ncbi:hypothetical protein IG631_02325 [Alternaria alternata]|nr:hypothetical protein IG631_02325 [Alternaria alternata]
MISGTELTRGYGNAITPWRLPERSVSFGSPISVLNTFLIAPSSYPGCAIISLCESRLAIDVATAPSPRLAPRSCWCLGQDTTDRYNCMFRSMLHGQLTLTRRRAKTFSPIF